jgi:hypothetical protein
MSSDPLDRARKLARDVAFGPPARPSGQDPGATPGLNPAVVKVLRTGGAVVLGSELLRRSRLARLVAAGGAVTYASRKRSGGDGWQDVQAPDARPR